MQYVKSPNLPDKKVSLAVVDQRIGKASAAMLENLGVKLLRLKPHPGLYASVSSHPDMLLHHVGENIIVYAPGTDSKLQNELEALGFFLIEGESVLAPSYPLDIAYNVARVGSYYFHNLKYTDPVIGKLLFKLDIEPIHVEQGYSKCSILPVNGHTVITTDKGIARAADKKGMNVLLLENERSISLPGLNYGFIGGAAGMLGPSLCVLTGNLETLDNFNIFLDFISNENVTVKSLSTNQITDIGSILPLLVY